MPTDQQTIPASEALTIVRDAVQQKGKAANSLTVLQDWQLIQVAQWITSGQSNDFIGRSIQDLWGQCESLEWDSLLLSIKDLRKRLLSGSKALDGQIEWTLDPLAENAMLIMRLKEEQQHWNTAARQTDATAETKAKSDRVSRLLSEAIVNHATMTAKLNDAGTPTGKGKGKKSVKPINIENANFLIADMSEGIPDFLGEVMTEIEHAAKPVNKPKRQLQ